MSINIRKLLVKSAKSAPVPLRPVTPESWLPLWRRASQFTAGLAGSQGFTGAPGQLLVSPAQKNGLPQTVYVGTQAIDMWSFSAAAQSLPKGIYAIDATLDDDQAYQACLGWALARYNFSIKNGQIDSQPSDGPRLLVPPAVTARYDELVTEIEASWAVRDRINAAANIMNTKELAGEVRALAKKFNAASGCIKGKALEEGFPLIHAVGRASSHKPRLAHLSWTGSAAPKDAPVILLVGKGIVFDSGGIQVKPGESMKLMKKDMGGAATALGLAEMIMGNDLPVRLKLVVPIAENAIAGNAFRPLDVITARNGTEVEIGHTDAEGRLVLADALSFGIEGDPKVHDPAFKSGNKKWQPDIIIDYATLTGAQRVADGTEVGGLFSNDTALGRALEDIGMQWGDPLQYHHLFETYRRFLKGQNGGEINSSPGGGPGATLAAMFLQHFTRAAKQDAKWLHFDINGMNVAARPGRPAGGEAMGMRAAYRYLKTEFGL